MDLTILPLAITMMAGPQIMSSFVLVTTKKPVRVSLAFLLGVAAAVTLGTAIARALAGLLDDAFALGDSSDATSSGNLVQVALVALLVVAAVKSWRGRETAQPPKWLGTLQTASAQRAFGMGIVLILLMPSDIVVMLTVGVNLQHNEASLAAAVPFIVGTVLVAALPLLGYLVFRRQAQRVMPQVRDWMNTHSWLVNIIVCGVFLALVLGA